MAIKILAHRCEAVYLYSSVKLRVIVTLKWNVIMVRVHRCDYIFNEGLKINKKSWEQMDSTFIWNPFILWLMAHFPTFREENMWLNVRITLPELSLSCACLQVERVVLFFNSECLKNSLRAFLNVIFKKWDENQRTLFCKLLCIIIK